MCMCMYPPKSFCKGGERGWRILGFGSRVWCGGRSFACVEFRGTLEAGSRAAIRCGEFLRLKGRISDPDFPGFDKSVHARGVLDQGLHHLFIMEVGLAPMGAFR